MKPEAQICAVSLLFASWASYLPAMKSVHNVDGKDPILTGTVLNPRPTK